MLILYYKFLYYKSIKINDLCSHILINVINSNQTNNGKKGKIRGKMILHGYLTFLQVF